MKTKNYKQVLGIRRDAKDPYFNYTFRAARKEKGLRLKDLARRAQIRFSTIAGYERVRYVPSPRHAERLAIILGKKKEELFPEYLGELTQEVQRERRLQEERLLLSKFEEDPQHDELLKNMDIEERKRYFALLEMLGIAQTSISAKYDTPERQKEKGDLLYELIPLHEMIETLTWREKEIICLRYGINPETYSGDYRYTLEELGRIFHLSRERVRQIEIKAIKKLRYKTIAYAHEQGKELAERPEIKRLEDAIQRELKRKAAYVP